MVGSRTPQLEALKQQLAAAQKDVNNAIELSSELLSALESATSGQDVSKQRVEALASRFAELSSTDTRQVQLRVANEDMFYDKLDCMRLKQALDKDEGRRTALLLQAIRWELTKHSAEEAKCFLNLVSNEDIIGLSAEAGTRNFVGLFLSDAGQVRQSVCRFLNALASFHSGRSYAEQNPSMIIPSLLEVVKTQSKTAPSLEHALAALQKLSVRSSIRTQLLSDSTVSWLLSFLQDTATLTDYSMEYATALLMNVVLARQGRDECAKKPKLVVQVLHSLLQHNNQSLLQYVNNVTFRLLNVKAIREEARKSTTLQAAVRRALKRTKDKAEQHQLECVLKQLNNEIAIDETTEMEEEDDNEGDFVEPEIEAKDCIEAGQGELSGRTLLNTCFGPLNIRGKTTVKDKRKALTQQNQKEQIGDYTLPGQRRPISRGAKRKAVAYKVRRAPQRVSSGASGGDKQETTETKKKPNPAKARPLPGQRKKAQPIEGRNRSTSETEPTETKKGGPNKPIRTKPTRPVRPAVTKPVAKPKPKPTGPVVTQLPTDATAPTAPVTERVATRVPKGSCVDEYVTAFGSRPRIARTPNRDSIATRGGQHYMFFDT